MDFSTYFFVVANTLRKLSAFWTKLLLVTETCETLCYRVKYNEIMGCLLKKIEMALSS